MFSDEFLNIARLIESQDSINSISRDDYSQIVDATTQISYLEALSKLILKSLNLLFIEPR